MSGPIHQMALAGTLVFVTIGGCGASLPTTATPVAPVAPTDWLAPPAAVSLRIFMLEGRSPLSVGDRATFSATMVRPDRVLEGPPPNALQWRVDNSNVLQPAQFSAIPGTFTAAGPGFVTVTASSGLWSDSLTLRVVPRLAPAPYLQLFVSNLDSAPPSIAAHAFVLQESGRFGTDVATEAQWESSDQSVVAARLGSVTPVGNGVAEVSATFGGLSQSTRVWIGNIGDGISSAPGRVDRVFMGDSVTWSESWNLRVQTAPSGTFYYALVDQNDRPLTPAPWPSATVFQPGTAATFSASAPLRSGTTYVCSQLMLVTNSGRRQTFRGDCGAP